MGVPYCFGWLLKQKKVDIIKNSNDLKVNNINILYFDWNCLLHPQCFHVLHNNVELKDIDKLERKMFKRIIEYTNYVIRFVCPTTYVYFAIDGVAPLAKIKQQRQRRFGYANDYKKAIYNKYNIPYNDSWSNVVITPGTDFMDRLHNKIIKYYKNEKNRKEYCNTNSKLKILYSSYHMCGEGEHKILQDLKNRFGTTNTENIVIYGLDADLIFLSMASKRNNIYLLREENMINNKHKKEHADIINEQLMYVNMDTTMECINLTFRDGIKKHLNYNNFNNININIHEIENISFVDDYILICYLLGNDFLPHFPSINLRRHGMELIINKYIENFCNNNFKLLIERTKDDVIINNYEFIQFINKISLEEHNFFSKKLYNYMRNENNRLKCYETEEYKKKIWEIENLLDNKEIDSIKLGIGDKNNWKFRYYKTYFGAEEHQDEVIDNICENYLEGLIWVAKYYFTKCIDWQWKYNYNHPPLVSDLNNFIQKKYNINNNILNDIKFKNNQPVNIFVQLLSVLPSKFNNLLPKTYQYLTISNESPIIDMYPIEYKIDKLYKNKLYECVPMIPNLNLNRIHKVIKDLKLDSREKKISKKENNLIIII